ncbi:glypican 6b precursor [Silurus meridionalis]|nr:glypican 6b precursor [Silurus meridionalis]
MVLARAAAAAALFLCALCASASAEDLVSASAGCGAVAQAYRDMGFSSGTVPDNYTAGESLQICTQNLTCCSPEMEQNFIKRSKHEFKKFVAEATEDLRNMFESRYKRFDDFFLGLLEKTERSLNEMFVRTYGELYTRNADVFQRLFSELKHYYTGGNVNLEEMIDDFWTSLMERMFQLLNSQYDINDDYMECVNKHMDDLKPFGDVPKKFKAQVSRAFVVARTFVQGLEFGNEVANNASKVSMSAACVSNVTEMLYCPYCQGETMSKPCKDYCLHVLELCLKRRLLMTDDWTRYVDEMLLLIERLEGPFNIESIMEPMDVKISDAIMSMQERTMELSYEVFQGCGQPKLLEKNRVARDVSSTTGQGFAPSESDGTNLQKLVGDVKGKLSEVKSFWSSLPEFVCQDENVAAPADEMNCWDGEITSWNVSNAANTEFIDFTAILGLLKRAYKGYQTLDEDSKNPNMELSSASRLHPSNLLLLLLLFHSVLSILTSLQQQR